MGDFCSAKTMKTKKNILPRIVFTYVYGVYDSLVDDCGVSIFSGDQNQQYAFSFQSVFDPTSIETLDTEYI